MNVLVVGLSAGGAALLLCVGIVVVCVYYRRKNGEKITNPLRKLSTKMRNHSVGPGQDEVVRKPTSTFHTTENDEDNISEPENIELQPSSFTGPMFGDDDLGDTDNNYADTITETTEPIASTPTRNQSVKNRLDRESVNFDATTKSFKLRDKTLQENTDNESVHNENDANRISRYQAGGEDYTLVVKSRHPSTNSKSSTLNYEYAKAISNEINKRKIEITEDTVKNDPSVNEVAKDTPAVERDEEYETMELEKDDIYANSESIRLSQITENHDSDTFGIDKNRGQTMAPAKPARQFSPRRPASEYNNQTKQAKAPVPQPRPSKRKTFDPYDHLPGIPISSTVRNNNALVEETKDTDLIEKDKSIVTNRPHNEKEADPIDTNADEDRHEKESSGSVIAVSESLCEDTDDIYDVPTSNRAISHIPTSNRAIADINADEDLAGDLIYDVPKSFTHED